MKKDDMFSGIGTVTDIYQVTPSEKAPLGKAKLDLETGESCAAVWWDAEKALQLGERVHISGEVRDFRGSMEIRIRSIKRERTIPDDPQAQVLGYLLDCINAEATAGLSVPPQSQDVTFLESGVSPIFQEEPVLLSPHTGASKWAQTRKNALGETLVAGFPLIVSRDTEKRGSLIISPLFVTDIGVEKREIDSSFSVKRLANSLDVNPGALEAMGLTRDEREECLASLEGSVEFEEANSAEERLHIGLTVLLSATGMGSFNPDNFCFSEMGALNSKIEGVYNACMLLAATGGNRVTFTLIKDLEQLFSRPDELKDGPLGVLLGVEGQEPGEVLLPEAHPIVVPSTLNQDQAVHSAMTNKLTVITGPPGTGKSQVLVNVVSAAVAKGESVLFASKNNKAVDVVFERIQEITPSAQLLRAGAASYRQELATTIKSAISPLPDMANSLVPLSDQRSIADEVNEVFGQLKKRLDLEVEAKELQKKAKKCADELSVGARIDCDVNELRQHAEGLKDSLQSFAQKLPFFRRRKRWFVHQERLVNANQTASHLNEFLVENNLDPFDTDSALKIVSNKPKRSLLPMSTVGDIERCVEMLSLVQVTLSEANELKERIERDFQTWTIEDDLAMLATRRLKAGRALLKMKWRHLLAENTESVAAAQLYVSELASGSIRAAKGRVQSIFPSFPAWGVTNLSTGTNFPLNKEMFDLVVIDEASQCDVASAIPLFFRAKRVLVIGDQRQLTHITNLGKNREKLFARRWKLLDAQEQTSKEHAMFNFKGQSLFSLSELRTGQPLLLNLHFRSQPAIISFSNHQFYDRRLEICTPRYVPLGGEVTSSIRWKDVKGTTVRGLSGRSWRNTEEAEEVVRELFELLSHGGTHQSIGVVTPFRPQCDEIRRIAQRDLPQSFSDVTIETVYKFQGDERDVMLFSPVVAEGMEPWAVKYATEPNLLNVALTRARDHLIVVGDRSACLAAVGTPLQDFAAYVSRIESSLFDSPLELELFEALLQTGVHAEAGKRVAGFRLDLAVEEEGIKLNIECDGAAFHQDASRDAARDASLAMQGWEVLRFSGREISRSVDSCVERIHKKIEKDR